MQAQHTWAIAVSSILILPAGGLLYKLRQVKNRTGALLQQYHNIINRQQNEIKLVTRKLQMKVLQAQINPHFIFNSLNHMQYYINQDDKNSALAYVARFSRYMRLVMQQANAVSVNIAEEILMLEQYMGMEQARFPGKFTYELHVAEHLPVNDMEVPPLLLYHYIENALYHGILNNNAPGHIIITFDNSCPHLVCHIQDNGIGRKEAKRIAAQKAGGSTMPHSRFTAERIAVMNEETPGRITVVKEDVINENGKIAGTLVTIGFATARINAAVLHEVAQPV